MADVREVQLLVIGGGPGGYPAALHAADHGLKVALVDDDAAGKLGGVCLNRGCIPSKALLHVAKLLNEARDAAEWGLTFKTPEIDLEKLRNYVQQKVVGKLTGGIGQLTKGRGVEVIKGHATFTDAHTVAIPGGESIRFKNCIIATGSVPAIPKPWQIGNDRIMDSTAALLLPDIPQKMLVIGGGYIGLEIGSVYAALGAKITVVEALDTILAPVDRDLVVPLEKKLRQQFEAIFTGTKIEGLSAESGGIVAKMAGAEFEGGRSEKFDCVLVSVGRRPNFANLGLEQAGVKQDERGFITVDKQRRTNVPHIQAIGDIAGEPGLAHKATAEARVAVEALLGEPSEWSPRAIPAVIFTDPEIAWAGLTQQQAEAQQVPHEVLKFPWAASGRAVSIARTEGVTKLLVDPASKRMLGAGLCGAGAGEMIAEAVLAIEMGAVARDLVESIHPHPTLSETVMEAAELAYGAATHMAKPTKR
ncbi:MAG TPA: dihydrolipoyl dehydrogenase [Urbifossiella sp.]|nr:dihydrolipoyl dehydrogenase [Urbifossiella sp.]